MIIITDNRASGKTYNLLNIASAQQFIEYCISATIYIKGDPEKWEEIKKILNRPGS